MQLSKFSRNSKFYEVKKLLRFFKAKIQIYGGGAFASFRLKRKILCEREMPTDKKAFRNWKNREWDSEREDRDLADRVRRQIHSLYRGWKPNVRPLRVNYARTNKGESEKGMREVRREQESMGETTEVCGFKAGENIPET